MQQSNELIPIEIVNKRYREPNQVFYEVVYNRKSGLNRQKWMRYTLKLYQMNELPEGPVPREIAKWLDSLDLAYQVRNMRRDLANGFIVAEILSRYCPKDININTIYNEHNLEKRRDNWSLISKVLKKKKEFNLPAEEYEPIFHQAPDVAQQFLFKLYELLTKKKLGKIFPDEKQRDPKKQQPKEVTLLRTKILPPIPTYAKPTANMLIKDREITRIIDEGQRKAMTQLRIQEHDEKARQDKKDENIIEYLIMKRKRQIEEEIKKQEEELLKKQMKFNKKLVSLDQSMSLNNQNGQDIKEIQINCYHSSTSKKAKEQQGQLMETKGVIDFLHEATANLFKKDPIKKAISELKLEPKEAQQNNGFQVSNQNVTYTNVIQSLFYRCDEGQKKSLKLLINQFVDVNIQLILEQVQNNFIDFKRFFTIFLRPLQVLKHTSKTYILIVDMIRVIGGRLTEMDANDTQMMFESILLEPLLQIALKNPQKREELVQLFYIFGPTNSFSRLHLLQSIKSKIRTDLAQFVLVLSNLIQMDYPSIDEDLFHYFFGYAILSLDSPSPLTRTYGLTIIKEIAKWSWKPILQRIDKINKLMQDSWWEVRAQGMCICAELLLFIADEEANPQEILEQMQYSQEDLQAYKQLILQIINSVFEVTTTQNMLKIGLIYLAPVLQKYPELCERYLEILLSVDVEIRATILNTDLPIQIGPVVQGCNTFKYKLTGAPINWNSVGVAKAIDQYVSENQLQNFEHEHLEIILGCLFNDLQPDDGDIWLTIFENIKHLLFLAFSDQYLCQYAQEILKKFLMFKTIQQAVLKNSFKIFLKLLSLIYHPDVQDVCKQNLLEFFQFLQAQQFQNYCYDIIKQFSENNKNMFLNSNLVDFMNMLAKQKRVEILGEQNY